MSHINISKTLLVRSALSLTSTLCAAYLLYQWDPHPRYPDFIVGSVTWIDGSKWVDLLVIPGSVVMLFCIWKVTSYVPWLRTDSLFQCEKFDESDTKRALAATFVSLWVTILAVWLVFCLDGKQTVGSVLSRLMTWGGEYPLTNISVLIVALPVFLRVRKRCLSFLRGKEGQADGSNLYLSDDILWLSTPALMTCAGLALGTTIHGLWMAFSFASCLFILHHSAYRKQQGRSFSTYARRSVLWCALLSLVPYALAMVNSRIIRNSSLSAKHVYLAPITFLLFLFLLAIQSWMRPSDIETQRRWDFCAGILAQLGIPLLLLSLFPVGAVDDLGHSVAGRPTKALTGLVIALMLATWAQIGWSVRSNRAKRTAEPLPVSSLTLYCLLVVWGCGAPTAPAIPPDDYHFGESLLGWWAYATDHLPFIGYTPAHGLLEDGWPGVICRFILDGKAVSMGEASRIALALLSLPSLLMFYRRTRSLAFSVLACLSIVELAPLGTSLLFMGLISCIWLDPWVRARSSRLLALWAASSPFVILAAPGQGTILVLCFGMLVLYQFVLDRKKWSVMHNVDLACLAAFMATMFVMSPLLEMCIGAVSYVMANGPVNQLTYGISWRSSWPQEGLLPNPLEMLRCLWGALGLLALAQCDGWRLARRPLSEVPITSVVLSAFCLLTTPYIMGRIDPGSISRMGAFSLFVWAFAIPVILLPLLPRRKWSLLWCLCMPITFALLGGGYGPSRLVATCPPKEAQLNITDGPKNGFTLMGRGFIEGPHLEQLKNIKAILDESLPAGEAYLDLTGRNANHFYLERKPLVSTVAPYNMGAPKIQRDVLSELEGKPQKIAILSANNIAQDGGPLALRAPRVYRYVLDRYLARKSRGIIVADAAGPTALRNRNDNEIELMDEALCTHHFSDLPIAWGRSVQSLEGKVRIVAQSAGSKAVRTRLGLHNNSLGEVETPLPNLISIIKHNQGSTSLDLRALHLSGRQASVLRMRWDCLGQSSDHVPVRGTLVFKNSGRPSRPVEFDFFARSGTLLVPLDSMAQWRLADEAIDITFAPLDPALCVDPAISEVALYAHLD